jgi:hypothetical protein
MTSSMTLLMNYRLGLTQLHERAAHHQKGAKSSTTLLINYRLGQTHLHERAHHHQKGRLQAMCGGLSLLARIERVTCQHMVHSAGIAPKHDPMLERGQLTRQHVTRIL